MKTKIKQLQKLNEYVDPIDEELKKPLNIDDPFEFDQS